MRPGPRQRAPFPRSPRLDPRARGPVAARLSDPVLLAALAIDTTIAVIDAFTTVVLINLVVVGPLMAAVRTGPQRTAIAAAYALALGIAEGIPHGIFGTPDHLVRCAAIALTGTLAVWGAGLRQRREAAERREAFLGEAAAVLSASLEYEATLQTISRLVVPALADRCEIHVRDEHGAIRRVVAAEADTATLDAGDDRGAMVAEVLRSGLAAVRTAGGVTALMVVPMTARGRTLGAIALMADDAARSFDDADLLTAEELGRRCGLAVDNARLYGESSRIARTLQESLLPSRIPDIPGLELATRFRAAGEGVDVGGDFLDVFEASDGRWVVVIGDVMGKGPEAAAVTALARYTIRATAVTAERPSDVLRALNDALLRQLAGDQRFCTAALAYVTPDGDRAAVELASAGHPLPLRVGRDRTVGAAGEYGMVLGIERTPPLSDSAVPLEAGDKLVFFTDGVIESRHEGRMLGTAGLTRVVRACAGDDPPAIATRIEATATEQGPPRDDIAVLVLQVVGRGAAQAEGEAPGG